MFTLAVLASGGRLPIAAAAYAPTDLEPAKLFGKRAARIFPLAPRDRGRVGAVPSAVTL